jgi:hypothetical protein
MTRGRVSGIACWIVAAVCLLSASFQAFTILRPVIFWRPTEATIEDGRVGITHDGEGFLLYFAETKMSFACGGQLQSAVVPSEFHTYKFAEISTFLRQRPRGTKTRVYCDRDNPRRPRYAIEYSRLILGTPGALLLSAVGLGVVGVWMSKKWLPPASCSRCRMPLKRYYRFCPHCRASLSIQPHLIAHDG